MEKEHLKETLEKHKKFLNNKGGEIANLRGANLRGANLSYTDLSDTDLSDTDLSDTDLSYADLIGANLRGANLRGANLSYTDLSDTDLSDTDLSYADLIGADLRGANLIGANLIGANLPKRFITICCIGSRKDQTTYCFEDNKIWCGCFFGTLEEFEIKVKETHENNEKFLKEYLGAINYIRSLI